MQKQLLISGPVGVGKTSTANEISTQLENSGVAHTFVDLDGLAYTFPRGDDDPHGDEIALENLTAVWANSRKRGIDISVLARVVESREYANKVANAVAIDQAVVCRLTGRYETLLARVRKREIGEGLAWHEKRALQLARELEVSKVEDFCVATDGCSVAQIAADVLDQLGWINAPS